MIKKLLLGLVLLLVIAAAAIYYLLSGGLNKGIKSGVETYGPRVTQTSVTLGSANVSVFSGSGSLKELKVGNPEGYKSENIFALGQIDLKVDTSTVFSDKIIIDEIVIKKPEISYETSFATSNLKQLLKNIEEFTGSSSDSEPDPAADEGAKKQVVIRKLLIEEGTVYVGALGVGQTVALPRIEMADIGEDGKQMTMVEAIDLVLSKVLQAIGPAISDASARLKDEGAALIQSTAEGATEKLDKAAGDAVDKASEGIKGLFGK